MFLLFLTTVQLNARIPQKLASWTLSYADKVAVTGNRKSIIYFDYIQSCIIINNITKMFSVDSIIVSFSNR